MNKYFAECTYLVRVLERALGEIFGIPALEVGTEHTRLLTSSHSRETNTRNLMIQARIEWYCGCVMTTSSNSTNMFWAQSNNNRNLNIKNTWWWGCQRLCHRQRRPRTGRRRRDSAPSPAACSDCQPTRTIGCRCPAGTHPHRSSRSGRSYPPVKKREKKFVIDVRKSEEKWWTYVFSKVETQACPQRSYGLLYDKLNIYK